MTILCLILHKDFHFEVRNEHLCMKCDRNLIQFLIDQEIQDANSEQNPDVD